eukprot:scaffold103942_cov42-Tisochrysis_lutea.AAC.3
MCKRFLHPVPLYGRTRKRKERLNWFRPSTDPSLAPRSIGVHTSLRKWSEFGPCGGGGGPPGGQGGDGGNGAEGGGGCGGPGTRHVTREPAPSPRLPLVRQSLGVPPMQLSVIEPQLLPESSPTRYCWPSGQVQVPDSQPIPFQTDVS